MGGENAHWDSSGLLRAFSFDTSAAKLSNVVLNLSGDRLGSPKWSKFVPWGSDGAEDGTWGFGNDVTRRSYLFLILYGISSIGF